jgi:hypothetical protein
MSFQLRSPTFADLGPQKDSGEVGSISKSSVAPGEAHDLSVDAGIETSHHKNQITVNRLAFSEGGITVRTFSLDTAAPSTADFDVP